jgi:RNA polymerase sigma-70 factor (ECF subfamily)
MLSHLAPSAAAIERRARSSGPWWLGLDAIGRCTEVLRATHLMDPDRSDSVLVLAIASRDREAFASLYRRYLPRVVAFLRKRNADEAIAAEIAQEVLLTVWKRADAYDAARASAASWIFTIARNRYIDRLRRERRPEVDPTDPAFAEADHAPDSALDAARRAEALEAAIASLPPEQGDLVRLAFLEGKSYRDIAEERGLPLGTVKSRFRLAFEKLRNLVASQEEVA